MIPEKCIVPGKDIKGLPLDIVCFNEDLEWVEAYLEETNWYLTEDFESNILSSGRKYKFIEYLVNYRKAYNFDLFVIRSLSQIQDNSQLAYALETWVVENKNAYVTPVYCIESEQIVTFFPNSVKEHFEKICDLKGWGYYE